MTYLSHTNEGDLNNFGCSEGSGNIDLESVLFGVLETQFTILFIRSKEVRKTGEDRVNMGNQGAPQNDNDND